jgi:hypothetical protein
MRRSVLLSILGLLALVMFLQAEYTFFTPPGSYAVEVSLENSAYLRLPIYRNAITSLAVVGDFAVGGTSASPGLSPFVFAVSLSKRRLERVADVSKVVPGQRAILSGFGIGSPGILYAGTMPDRPGVSGHLIEIKVLADRLTVEDRGVPVEGEGVFSVIADSRAPVIYGISHPSGKFFVFDLQARQVHLFPETAPSRETLAFLQNYALKPEDILSRRLIMDRKGRVYGSMPVNKHFRFDSASRKIEVLPEELPEGWGRKPLGRVDAWAVAPDGMLYGGNAADGQLFRLDPDTGRVTNLGKPIQMPRLKGLAFAVDGKLYGVGGATPGYAHLFSYDPKGKGYRDLGNPRFVMTEPGLEEGIFWRGFQIGTLAASQDGRHIVMGEEEALSQLMVFPVK